MSLDQPRLVGLLTENMNEAMTSWVVASHYELAFTIGRIIAKIPALADSVAQEDGMAHSAAARTEWICMDGEIGSGVFLFPRDSTLFNQTMHGPILALRPELSVFPGIYGSLDDAVWQFIGGATVIPTQKFLTK